MYLGEKSDTSCGIYMRVASKSVSALYPEALFEGDYYEDCGY